MRIRKRALTFEDVLLVPAKSEVLPRDVCIKTKLIIINKANPIKNKTFLLVIRILFLLIKNKIIVKREI